jgi:hypothetical protein
LGYEPLGPTTPAATKTTGEEHEMVIEAKRTKHDLTMASLRIEVETWCCAAEEWEVSEVIVEGDEEKSQLADMWEHNAFKDQHTGFDPDKLEAARDEEIKMLTEFNAFKRVPAGQAKSDPKSV